MDKAMKQKKDKSRKKYSSGSESDEWVEMQKNPATASDRDDWMKMTGVMKTYTKSDIRTTREEKNKKNIDSYNPGTSVRELNPYWKDGGSGLPQTSDQTRRSKQFLRPSSDGDFYSKSSNSQGYLKPKSDDDYYSSKNKYSDRYEKSVYVSHSSKSGSWRKESHIDKKTLGSDHDSYKHQCEDNFKTEKVKKAEVIKEAKAPEKDDLCLSDEKMNKLAAKIVKAEIMGDTALVNKLKTKLENAREYRKQNPDAVKQASEQPEEQIMLTSTNSVGNCRPLTKSSQGDPHSKHGKRKAETHFDRERQKYFANDDKYNLSQMFEQEKYGSNYDNDAELAKIASKHKNPNDDLEDIFTEDISKNRNTAKDDLRERERAIKQDRKMERTIEDCEYCVGSRKMMTHLMMSCGEKVYLAVPSRTSLQNGHCILTTTHHVACVTAVDEEVWEEIMDYRKALVKYFNQMKKDVIFFETATKLNKFPHLVIHCVPIPRDVGDALPIYFKKALLDCEAEWAMNKKVIDLRGKNIRRGVPKGLPYFWVDFAMDPGFAHVIEDQQLFPKNFAEEIIGGILDLEHNAWKNPQKETTEQQRKKAREFLEQWKPFDNVAKRFKSSQ